MAFAYAVLLAVASGHSLLQLSQETTPVRLSTQAAVDIGDNLCAQSNTEFTIGGWFRADGPSLVTLVEVQGVGTRVSIERDGSGQVAAVVQGEKGETVTLVAKGEAGWNYVALAQSEESGTLTLCVRQWAGGVECAGGEKPLWVSGLDLKSSKVFIGSPDSHSLEVFDVNIASVALTQSEVESMAESTACRGPCTSVEAVHTQTSILTATCLPTGLQQQPNRDNLIENYNWDWGVNMFLWDDYDYGVNFSTVKVKIDLNDVIGDPDMEVYIYHFLSENEFLGKSNKVGPDSLTFDWNTPRFKNEIPFGTVFRVYINGKSWFNWYAVTFNYYSTSWIRESSGREIYTLQKVEAASPGLSLWFWAALAAAGVAAGALVRKARKGEGSRRELLEAQLLTPIEI